MSVSVLFVFVCIPVCGGGNVWVQTQECVCVYVCAVGAVWRPILHKYRWYCVHLYILHSCWSVGLCIHGCVTQGWGGVYGARVRVQSSLFAVGDDDKSVHTLCTVCILQYL